MESYLVAKIFLIFYLDIYLDRKQYSMINSKNKGACAYVKTSKSKPKQQNILKEATPSRRPSKDQKENIYDQLMNDLQAEDSEYVLKLLAKQEKKARKKENTQSNKQMKTIFCEKNNPNIAVSNRKNTNRVSTNKPEKLQISALNSHKVANRQFCEIKTQTFRGRKSQNQTGPPFSKFQKPSYVQRSSFVNHINQYIYQLSNENIPIKDEKIRKSREFRKTLEIVDRKNGEDTRDRGINLQKYKSLLFQLEQSLLVNDQLQQENENHRRKIQQAKQIVRAMWSQIQQLQDELNHEKNQKLKYRCLFEQFALRVKKIDSKSVDRSYLQHKKRNSHIPQPCSFFFDNSYNKRNCYNYYEDRRKFDLSHLQRQREQQNTLKKKGKQHKYKISQNCLQLLEKDMQSTASIYRQKCY